MSKRVPRGGRGAPPPKLPQNQVPREVCGAVAGQSGQSAFAQVRGGFTAPQPKRGSSKNQPLRGCPAPYPVLWNGAGPQGSGQDSRKHP